MSQVGAPDYLGNPVGYGAPLIELIGVQRGAVDYQTPTMDTDRVQSVRVMFSASPGTTVYRLAWSFRDPSGVFGVGDQIVDIWSNGWVNMEIPVMGSTWFLAVQHVGGVPTDQYNLVIWPSFVSASKPKAPVDGGILYGMNPVNFAVGETKTFNVQKCAWGVAYLQYGLNGAAWLFQGKLLDAGGALDGYAWSLITPANLNTDVKSVMLTPSLLQVSLTNNTGAINSAYFTLAMAP